MKGLGTALLSTVDVLLGEDDKPKGNKRGSKKTRKRRKQRKNGKS